MWSSRFCTAPDEERAAATLLMAASIDASVIAEPEHRGVDVVGRAGTHQLAGGDADRLAVLGADLCRDGRAAGSRLMPLNLVFAAIAPIWFDWATSAVMAALSLVESVPLLYWTARSRTRYSIESTSAIAPSAVCTRLIAS